MSNTKVPDIVSILDKETKKRIKIYPHTNNRASEAGHPCERFLVLSRLKNEFKPLPDLALQRIFDEGKNQERIVLHDLERAFVEIIEPQRLYEWRKFKLTGHIDGKIRTDDNDIPLEIKSCSPNVFHAIKDIPIQGMLKSKYSWIKKYPAQILLYMMMEGCQTGIMLFKNKTTGEIIQKNIELDDWALEYLESILKKLERVNEFVDKKVIPEKQYINECSRCPFAKTECFPDRDYGPGFDFIDDAEIEAKLKRMEEIKETAKEYEELKKEITEQFKGKTSIIGDWIIESKEIERKNYIIPDNIKNKYLEMMTYWKTSIKKL